MARQARTMEELHEDTSRELMAAYAQETLIYTDTYLTQVRTVTERVGADDADFDAGRKTHNLAVTYFDKNDPTAKVGTGFIKISGEARYTASGKLDNACKRYAELAKALRVSGFSVDEVVEHAQQELFLTRVREVYVVPENDLHPSNIDSRVGTNGDAWVTLDREDQEAREYYLDLGLEPKVMVDRITRVKA